MQFLCVGVAWSLLWDGPYDRPGAGRIAQRPQKSSISPVVVRKALFSPLPRNLDKGANKKGPRPAAEAKMQWKDQRFGNSELLILLHFQGICVM